MDLNDVHKENFDILSRMMFMHIMHKTYAGTGSICTAVACRIPGTIPNLHLSPAQSGDLVRIGHPGGIITLEADVSILEDGSVSVKKAAIGRTARTIMEGTVFVRESAFD